MSRTGFFAVTFILLLAFDTVVPQEEEEEEEEERMKCIICPQPPSILDCRNAAKEGHDCDAYRDYTVCTAKFLRGALISKGCDTVESRGVGGVYTCKTPFCNDWKTEAEARLKLGIYLPHSKKGGSDRKGFSDPLLSLVLLGCWALFIY